MSTRCEKFDLPTDQCAHCLGQADPQREARAYRTRLLASGGWFEALYPGTCESCGERFEAGAAIRMDMSASLRGWRAECCAEAAS